MKSFLSAIITRLIIVTPILISSVNTIAQTDQQLFDYYLKNHFGSSDLSYYTSRYAQKEHGIADSIYLEIKSPSEVQQTMSLGLHKRVIYLDLIVSDSTELSGCLQLLKDFHALKYLKIQDMRASKGKAVYQLPESIRRLRQVRVIELSYAQHLDMPDAIEKFRTMSNLRGLVFTNHSNPLPSSVNKLNQISFVKLNKVNLQNLDLQALNWKMLSLTGNYRDIFDESLAGRLSAMASLKELNLSQYSFDSTQSLKKLQQITTLDISNLHESRGIQLFNQLADLKKLRHLTLKGIDSTQNLGVLEKLVQLESLSLIRLPYLKSHPEVLQAISGYQNLNSLKIEENYLTEFPNIFGPLQQLRVLSIRNNNFKSGQIPIELFRLPNLTTLDLSSNELTELPDFPYQSERIKNLDLSYNKLTRIPGAILKLNKLETILAPDNLISAIPVSGWESLSVLKTLIVDNNQITLFPGGIQNISTLSVLNLSNNHISEFPEPTNRNYRLRKLYLNNNQVKSLPEHIDKFTFLEELEASDNKLTRIPPAVAKLESLSILNLGNNSIADIPIKGFRKLQVLELANNINFSSSSAFDLVLSANRKDFILDLSNTGVTALPATGQWANIEFKHLNLTGNKITTLPVELTLMKSGRVTLEGNPLKMDTPYVITGFRNRSDMKLLYNELGIPTPDIQVSAADYAKSLTERVSSLCRPGAYAKAVAYADKAIALDNAVYEKNIWWPTIARCRLEINDYTGAIRDCDYYLERGPFGYIDGGSNMRHAEYCKTTAYLSLGQKEKAAETYVYFGENGSNLYSYLNAAFLYKELGKDHLYKKYMDSTVSRHEKEHAGVVKYGSPWSLYEYVEILIMAGKPAEALKLFKNEQPGLFDENPSIKNYLEAIARFVQNPAAFENIKKELADQISKNGKIKDWYYRRFNTWIEATDRPQQQKEQLYALQNIGK